MQFCDFAREGKKKNKKLCKKVAKKFALENFLLKNDIFFAKKFAKYNLFIVSLQRRSGTDRNRVAIVPYLSRIRVVN